MTAVYSPLGCRTSCAGFAVVPRAQVSIPSVGAETENCLFHHSHQHWGQRRSEWKAANLGRENMFLQVENVCGDCGIGLFHHFCFFPYSYVLRICRQRMPWMATAALYFLGLTWEIGSWGPVSATTDPLWHILVLVGQCSLCCCPYENAFCGVARAALTLFLSSRRVS